MGTEVRQLRPFGRESLYGLLVPPLDVRAVDLLTLHDEKRGKDLQLRLVFPLTDRRLPVIVFSPFAGGTKDHYRPLIAFWASRGYVCVLPNHADSLAIGGERGPEARAGMVDRPGDVSFILDSLPDIEERVPEVRGKLDLGRIGVGGHFMGAGTAALLIGFRRGPGLPNPQNTGFEDGRVRAVAMLSPTGREGDVDQQSYAGMTKPMLVMTGSTDPSSRTGNGPIWRTEPFWYSPPGNKYLVFIDGLRSDYDGLSTNALPDGEQSTRPTVADYIKSITLAFWDAYLGDGDEAARALAYLSSKQPQRETLGHVEIIAQTQAVGSAAGSQAIVHPNEGGATVQAQAGSSRDRYRPIDGPFAADVEDLALLDKTRGRPVLIRVCAAGRDAKEGPFPVIIFSHGFGESRTTYGHHGRHWAQHGYITIVVNHKGTDTAAMKNRTFKPGDPGMLTERPKDLSFVIDQLGAEAVPSRLLRGRVDLEHIGVAGHSLGSTTSLTMVGLTFNLADRPNASFSDPRVKAAIAMSPQIGAEASGQPVVRGPGGEVLGLNQRSWAEIASPAMLIMGTDDRGLGNALRLNPALRRIAFEGLAPGDKYLIDIVGAQHHAFTDTDPWYEAAERDPRHYDWIAQAATAFFDGYLKSHDLAVAWLHEKRLFSATDGLCEQENK